MASCPNSRKDIAKHGVIDLFFGLQRSLTDISGDQACTVYLYQLSLFENAELLIDLGQQPCHSGFSGSGVAEENQVLGYVGGFQASGIANLLDLDHVDQR